MIPEHPECVQSGHLRAWLEIDIDVPPTGCSMKGKAEYYYGWYCTRCHLTIGRKGVR